MGWVWLDGVEAFEKEKFIKAWKKWESSFPLVYVVELMAQAGAILLGAESDFGEDIVFTKIEAVEFFTRPEPGKRLEIEVHPESLKREGGWFAGQVLQDGQAVAEGRVLLMNVKRLRPDGKGPVTFPKHLIVALRQPV